MAIPVRRPGASGSSARRPSLASSVRRASVLATALVVMLPSIAAAQGGEWPTLRGAGLEYLSRSGFLQVTLSGQLDMEVLQVGGGSWAGLINHQSGKGPPQSNSVGCVDCHIGVPFKGAPGSFIAHRLRFFADVFLGDQVYSLVEVRSDRGHVPTGGQTEVRIEQAYVRVVTIVNPSSVS